MTLQQSLDVDMFARIRERHRSNDVRTLHDIDPGHPEDIAGRAADRMAGAHRADGRHENHRPEELFEPSAPQSERGIEESVAVRDRSGLGPKAREEAFTIVHAGRVEEEDGRDGRSSAARTVQIPNEFAAEDSPEMSQKDPDAAAPGQLVAEPRSRQSTTVHLMIKNAVGDDFHRRMSSANGPSPQSPGKFFPREQWRRPGGDRCPRVRVTVKIPRVTAPKCAAECGLISVDDRENGRAARQNAREILGAARISRHNSTSEKNLSKFQQKVRFSSRTTRGGSHRTSLSFPYFLNWSISPWRIAPTPVNRVSR